MTRGYNLPDNVSPNKGPWVDKPDPPMKEIEIAVRLKGVVREKIKVPAGLDIDDASAVAAAIEEGAPWGNFWSLTLGDLYFGQKKAFDDTHSTFDDGARCFLEAAEEV